jgi:hypothetical protein
MQIKLIRGCGAMVAQNLPKIKVVGSNPITRSAKNTGAFC